jgi:putative tryptophan/tyrosine transport system substrate-binding protein
MKRREFITLLGGAAAAWPLAARAQQRERMRRVGVLMGYAQSDPSAQSLIAGFVQRLQRLGWTVGQNVSIEDRWAGGDINRIQQFAKELIKIQPDVILANTTPVTVALHRETRTIPIIFAIVSDPVGAGLIASLAQPGENITGFINVEASMGGKWLELLKEIAPGVRRAAIMFNPDTAPGADNILRLRFRPLLGLWGSSRSLPSFAAVSILKALSQHWDVTQAEALLSRQMAPCWCIGAQSFP